MPERLSTTQSVQLGVETTPGTSVAANRQLPSLQLTTGIGATFTEVLPVGYKFPTAQVPGKEWVDAKLSASAIGYDEIIYLLAACLAAGSGVQQSSTTAYKWTQGPSSTVADSIKTYTVEQGDAVRAHKFAYGIVTDLALKGDRDKVELSGSMIGQQLSDGITMTTSPTVVAQVPILSRDVSVYFDSTGAGLGTTKLGRVLSWEWSLKNRFSPLWVVDSSKASWVAHTETAIQSEIKLQLEADSTGNALITSNMRNGTTGFIRIDATSTQNAGTAIPYSCKIDMAGQVKDAPSEFSDVDGVYAYEITFGAIHDSTWGKALEVNTINKRTAL